MSNFDIFPLIQQINQSIVIGPTGPKGKAGAAGPTGPAGSGGSGGGGDVEGPSSSTTNALARFANGSGKIIENSSATLSDAGVLAVDQVSTDTIAERTLDAGISVDGCLIKDGSAALANAVPSGTITNDMVNATAAVAYSKLDLSGSIIDADIAAGAGIVDTKLATITTAGKVANSATTATSTNTADSIITRDASGNFSANVASITDVEFPEGGSLISRVVRGPLIDNALAIPYLYINFNDDTINPTYGPTPILGGAGGVYVNSKPSGPFLGRAFDSEGTAYLDFGDQINSTMEGRKSWTFCCWVNIQALPGGTAYIVRHGSSNRFNLNIDSSGYLNFRAEDIVMTSSITLSTSTWYWVAIVADTGECRMYIDNVERGNDLNVPDGLKFWTDSFVLFYTSSHADAYIDDVSIYTSTITTSQRAAIFANGGNGEGDPSTSTAIARWANDTGNRVNNSGVQIDNSGNLFPTLDSVQDCGSATNRWDDVYAANATIQTSDVNLKRDIVALGSLIPDPKAFLMALNPVIFKWKDFQYVDLEGDLQNKVHTRDHFGLIAQEVEATLDAQGIDKNQFAAWTLDSSTGRQGLRYVEFIPILIKANQQLIAALEQAQTAIADLQARVTALENP